MPTIPPAELDALIARVGRRWKADALARELCLDDATRARLKIKTIGAIDCSKAQRLERSDNLTDGRRAHGAKASTFTAKPLPSPSFRVQQSCDQARTDLIVAGLDAMRPTLHHHTT